MPGPLRIALGSDRAGSGHRAALRVELAANAFVSEVLDIPDVAAGHRRSYPDVALAAGQLVAHGAADRALLICHTGLGMAIAANKVRGVRAVTAHDPYSVEHAVLFNNAQVLCLGQAIVDLGTAVGLVRTWLGLRFDPGASAALRIAAITAYEQRT
ncbi:RpiB/LacA/LacB family sugar-phosphate isomerase [Kitasatospora sp. NPDC092039]|uniref:RpiB/LacA/LacB family sugar-phosphate isomerase n=1 Tax=Kitasatospora sp. NPDC092039 TaxID=3364086 RepID=UPI0038231D55